jgi:lycopene beta-cyclase
MEASRSHTALTTNDYDYIITGAGCAGLSLLMRMMADDFFLDKKILIIDALPKQSNDRTWCFWEQGSGLFEPIVKHSWRQVQFASDTFSALLQLAPYQYKMIEGLDFYQMVLNKAKLFDNINFLQETVLKISDGASSINVSTASGNFLSNFVFNSIPAFASSKFIPGQKGQYHLLQHFKGWVIETAEPKFDSSMATLMDFQVDQSAGTTFMYVMPVTNKKALVEYTLFTEALLTEVAYEKALKNYISTTLKINNYQITHEEFGIIPMTNQKFPLQEGRLVQMGGAGGQIKGSSGYAFQFIQKRTAAIIRGLKKGSVNFNHKSWKQFKGEFYDTVLLQVLQKRKMHGDEIFSQIFGKNSTASVLQFLDNDASLMEDLRIMNSVPKRIFFPAAIQELLRP